MILNCILAEEQGLRIALGLHPIETPFRSDAALLVSPKRGHWRQVKMRIHPDIASLHLFRNLGSLLEVLGPDGSTKPRRRVVGSINDLLLVVP